MTGGPPELPLPAELNPGIPTSALRASIFGMRATRRARQLLLIGAPVLCSAILIVGYAWHQHELVDRQRRLAAEASARLQEILIKEQGLTESVMETSGGMTYDEFFRACDRSVNERNKLVVEVRLLSPNVLSPFRDRLISYMKSMNELVRAKAQLMRLTMQWQSKTKSYSADFARYQAEFSGLGGAGSGHPVCVQEVCCGSKRAGQGVEGVRRRI